jgi:hypothetical protein
MGARSLEMAIVSVTQEGEFGNKDVRAPADVHYIYTSYLTRRRFAESTRKKSSKVGNSRNSGFIYLNKRQSNLYVQNSQMTVK